MKMKRVCILCALAIGISSTSACGSQPEVETTQEDSILEDASSMDDEDETDDLSETDTETEDTESHDVSKDDLFSASGYSIPEKLYVTNYFKSFNWDSFPEKAPYADWSNSEYCVKYPWNTKSFEENFVTEDEEPVDFDSLDKKGIQIYPVDYVNGLWSVKNYESLGIYFDVDMCDENLSEKEQIAYCVENELWICNYSDWETISIQKLADFFETKGVPDHFFVSELLGEEHCIRYIRMIMQYEYDDFSILLPVIAEFIDDTASDDVRSRWWMYPIGSPEIYADFANQDYSMIENGQIMVLSNNYLEKAGGAVNYWEPLGIFNYVQIR